MTTGITEREWEDLSAYIDGQLAPQEKARLERTLRSRADLRAAMGDLRRTRELLRDQPAIRAPRNFTLSPKVVKSHQPRSLFSGLFQTMRVASVVASILFVLVLLGDLFVPKAGGSVPMAAKPEESMPIEQAVQEAAPVQVQESVEKEAERVLEAGSATPDVGTTLGLPMVNAQPFSSTEMSYPLPEEIPAPAELALDESTLVETPAEQLPEEGFKALDIQEGETTIESDALQVDTQSSAWTVWRFLEVGLAIVGLSTGLIAIILRFSGRA